jgi:uncharacterized membrane protein required for colicin V production
MTTGKNNKIYISFAILFFVFIFIFSGNAQTASKTNDDLTSKLQQKILLTQTQAEQIKTLLNDYFNNPSEEKRSVLESKIESLLDSKQKMKYSIVKKDWWNSVIKEATKAK